MLTVAAHAKLNLFLRVLDREPDGYHRIETLFCRLVLADTLEFEAGERGIDLQVEGARLGEPGDNLVHRAASLFHHAIDRVPALRIRLVKRIPAGGGLGGGSSDAAATLLALNRLHGEPLDALRLFRLGRSLGSDVPFFLTGSALALGAGRGDQLRRLPALPAAHVLLTVPAGPINTGQAYAELAADRATAGGPPARAPIDSNTLTSWDAVAAHAGNDFEPLALNRFSELREAREILLAHGARIASLTGSGSCFFGLFTEPHLCAGAQRAVQTANPALPTLTTETISRPPAGTGGTDLPGERG